MLSAAVQDLETMLRDKKIIVGPSQAFTFLSVSGYT